MPAKRLRVTLRYIEILDSKDVDMYGEFRFRFQVSVSNRQVARETRIPEEGHLSISDHPSMNKIKRQDVLFEADVEDGDTLVVEAGGEELDTLSANDQLTGYRREFTGPIDGWVGEYGPWDEGGDQTPDPEQLGDWRIAYAIELAG